MKNGTTRKIILRCTFRKKNLSEKKKETHMLH